MDESREKGGWGILNGDRKFSIKNIDGKSFVLETVPSQKISLLIR